MLNSKSKLIGNRMSYFLMPAAIIALLPLGLVFHLPWLGIVVGAIAVPLADEFIGAREPSIMGPTVMEVRLLLIVLLGVIGWSLFQLPALQNWTSLVLAAISSGYILGAVGIPGAHEMGHRRSGFDKFLGQLLLACAGYGHYQVSHSRHHKRAGLLEDPATARQEESLWRFFPRYFVGIWQDASEVAARSKGYRRHKPVLLLMLSAVMLGAATFGFGVRGLTFWLIQAVVSLLMIGSVDYIQHWGLRRRVLADGRYERQGPAHTWESPFWLSERTTFNLPRHSFHHLVPSKEVCDVERVPTSPQMPLSYGTMVIVATFPPLFRRLMEPRLPITEQSDIGSVAKV